MAIAILGRPNVGKSSLFNALVGQPKSLVWDQAGVTRDRVVGEWVLPTGGELEIWDFAGWDPAQRDSFRSFPIRAWQSQIDLVLFVLDGSIELSSLDEELAIELRKTGLPVLLIFNKSDKRTFDPNELLKRKSLKGWPHLVVSAERKEGLLDLADEVKKKTEQAIEKRAQKNQKTDASSHRVLILGRPNVGKSSLLNRLAGTDVAFVADEAGTTRDIVEFEKRFGGQNWQFVDSAGVRKKSKIYGRSAEAIEIFSVHKALHELRRADFCILVVEPHPKALFHTQDKKLLRLVAESRVPCLVVVNKWDQIRDHWKARSYLEHLTWDMASFAYLPLMLISARTGFQVKKIFEKLIALEKSFRRLKTSDLNRWLIQVQTEKQPKLARKGQSKGPIRTANQYLKYFYMVQLCQKPMRFQIFCNAPQAVAKDEKRFLERRLRETYNLEGLPLELLFRKKTS